MRSPSYQACIEAGHDSCRSFVLSCMAQSVDCPPPSHTPCLARCREFPSLINCTTIDWFNAWPAEALRSVAAKFLDGTDVGGPQVRAAFGGELLTECMGV